MCKAFYYKSYDFDYKTGVLTLNYEVQDETNNHFFTERIFFPTIDECLADNRLFVLNRIFFLTHIAFGISYFKAFCPQKLYIESGSLTQQEADFFNRFYLEGLGEFAVRNQLNLQGKISFPFSDELYQKRFVSLQQRFLIPVGGGKDSCVSIETIKDIGYPCMAVSVGNPRPIQECVRVSGLPHLILRREISPHLIELNKTGRVFNGHVPITGMLAFLLWACSIIYDYRFVALSCERSANSCNLMQGDLPINHQFSKSFEFEKMFYDLTTSITPEFRYFSLLRPLSELHIARLFGQQCSSFFDVFTSCNRAFKLDETIRIDRWCGNCDKCRFVFLILAPFMDKKRLVQIIGKNLLDDETQLTGFEELLGLKGHKPFECVGEIEESCMAFSILAQSDSWKNDKVIKLLSSKIPFLSSADMYQKLLTPDNCHLLPKEIATYVMERFKR